MYGWDPGGASLATHLGDENDASSKLTRLPPHTQASTIAQNDPLCV